MNSAIMETSTSLVLDDDSNSVTDMMSFELIWGEKDTGALL